MKTNYLSVNRLWQSLAVIAVALLLFSFIRSNSEITEDHRQDRVVQEQTHPDALAQPALIEPFIGQITMFGGNFAPRGWAFCDGQLLSISQNTALFSILGTTYGGDGRTTFGLPDLRGRVPVHAGQGPGLPNVRLGQKGGGDKVSLHKETPGLPSQPGAQTNTRAYQSVNYIIALQGVFPSRN